MAVAASGHLMKGVALEDALQPAYVALARETLEEASQAATPTGQPSSITGFPRVPRRHRDGQRAKVRHQARTAQTAR
jgi:hypothetical protein